MQHILIVDWVKFRTNSIQKSIGMATLDACAGSTTEGFTLSEYAEACSREVDAAVAAW